MPGPCSTPKALGADGNVLEGKSAIRRAGAISGQRMELADYTPIRILPLVASDLPPRARKAVTDKRDGT